MGRFVFPLMSTAFPAAWLLYGLVFAMAAAHFLSLPWVRSATVVVYSIPVLWCLLILRNCQFRFAKFNAIDVGFVAFVLVVLTSAFVFPGVDEHGAVWKYLRFMPFLMITPYVLGRLMSLKDVELLSRIIIWAGLVLLPLLLLDRLTVVERPWRLPIFGLDHGPLMVGGLLATTLLALCSQMLSLGNRPKLKKLVLFGVIGLVTVVLVWVMARGWLLASLVAAAVVTLAMRDRSLAQRLGLLVYVFSIAMFALFFLPASDFYGAVFSAPAPAPAPAAEFCPILGDASCQPFKDGVDSVAMRWVMYREAWALFMQNPVWGVGVARFGDCSCTGPGWYPHNTILQGFAELGLIGGGFQLGVLILTAVTLARPLLSARHSENVQTHALVFALFALFMTSDQFYSSYLMASGTWLMLGIAASLRVSPNEESSRA